MARKPLLQRLARGFALLAVMTLLGTLLLACGDEEDLNTGNTGSNGDVTATPTSPPASPTTNPDLIEHPTGDEDVIIRIGEEGGFVMQQTLLTRLPSFILFGNGCYVIQGPQIAIYPAPALPNLQQTCLNEDGVQAILAKAKEAGLLDGDAEYRNDMIADATTTVFTVTAGGKTSVVRAYALGLDTDMDAPNLSDEDKAAREKLATFIQDMGGVDFWIEPEMIVEEAHPYEIERMQVSVLPVTSPSAPQLTDDLEPQILEWPLETSLADYGTPFLGEFRCDVIEGEDLAALMPLLEQANQLTQWVSSDNATQEATDEDPHLLFLRPLFATEEPCV